MKPFKTNWDLQLGDGTGSSIKDGQIRNAKSICGIKDCNQPLNPNNNDNEHFFGIKLCDEDSNKVHQEIRKIQESVNLDFINDIKKWKGCDVNEN